MEEEKRHRDVEIKRRENERKKRHDQLARDGKKSFFELNQAANDGEGDAPVESNADIDQTAIGKSQIEDSPKSRVDKKKIDETPEHNKNDMNALDYEADKDDHFDDAIAETSIIAHRAEISTKNVGDKHKDSKADKSTDKTDRKDKSLKKSDRKREKRERSKSVEKRSKRRSRSRSPRRSNLRQDRDRRDVYRRRNHSPYRGGHRRDDYRDKNVRRDSRRRSR